MVRPSPLIQLVHILKYKGPSSIATPVEKTPTSPDQRGSINAPLRNNSFEQLEINIASTNDRNDLLCLEPLFSFKEPPHPQGS